MGGISQFPDKGPAVPAENGALNTYVSEVIGNKTDDAFSDGSLTPSIVGHLVAAYQHVHNSSRVYPRTDDNTPLGSVNVASAAGAWNFGSWTEIIAAATVPNLFDMHWVIVSDISSSDEYVLQLGYGSAASEVFWGECAFARDAAILAESQSAPIQGPPLSAGTRVAARLASASGSDNVDVKIYTHMYPPVT